MNTINYALNLINLLSNIEGIFTILWCTKYRYYTLTYLVSLGLCFLLSIVCNSSFNSAIFIGLNMHWHIPTFRHFCTIFDSLWAVTATIVGLFIIPYSTKLLISIAASRPFITGILISIRIKSKPTIPISLTLSTHSLPLHAFYGYSLFRFSIFSNANVLVVLSSTINIFRSLYSVLCI